MNAGHLRTRRTSAIYMSPSGPVALSNATDLLRHDNPLYVGRDRNEEHGLLKPLMIALLVALSGCATTNASPLPQPNIYIMRHLHTPAGVSNAELTEEGRRFALLASDWFRRDPPDVIYVSTTRRAQQTAEPASPAPAFDPETI